MKRMILAILFALLAGCGSKSGQEPSHQEKSPPLPSEGELSSLNGLPLEEFVRAIIPRLAKEPGIQGREEIIAALNEKWKIHCEQICQIERKTK